MSRQLIQFVAGQKEAIAQAILHFLDRPDAAGRLMTAMGGFIFEEWLIARAADDGLRYEDLSRRRLPYDVVINGLRIQAKSSGSTDGIVDVRPVRPVVGSNCRRYSLQDFDVLAIHLASFNERYFIPVSAFECDTYPGMAAGSFNRSRHAKWLEAWHVVSHSSGAFHTQSMLFS